MKSLAKKLVVAGRAITPYLAIEMMMPGGSLLAVMLWLYRLRTRAPDAAVSASPQDR